MFFDGSVRSTRNDELLRPPRHEGRLPLEHAGIVREPLELLRIDADRPRHDTGRAAAVLDRSRVRSTRGAEQPLDREQEGAPPALGVEADDVVREQALVHRHAQLRRQRVPVVRLAATGCGRSATCTTSGRASRTSARREIEVVVVEQHGRVGLSVELLERGRRERLVDRHVASRPRLVELRAESGATPRPRDSAGGTRASGSRRTL